MDVDENSDYESDNFEYTYTDEDDESVASDTNSEMDESVGAGGTGEHGKGRKRSSNGGPCYNFPTQNDESEIRMVGTSEIVPIMNQKIKDVTEILAIPPSAAVPLLRHHKWDKDRLFDSYTTNSERELRDAGVYHRCIKRFKSDSSIEDVSSSNNQNLNGNQQSQEQILKDCTICYDEKPQEEMLSMPCGHEFCLECWKSQIQITLESGPSCILATCPAEKCNEIVTEEEVSKVAQELLPKFTNYQLRNFVELNGTSRWCPGPGCDRIAAMTGKNSSLSDANSIVATCDVCSTIFCIKCGAEPHAPLICSVLDTWNEKCKNESETANWILANTKKCPKCNTRIEKNQGCNHMTCQQCKHEFCWVCIGDWSQHGQHSGGYYNCNKFQMDAEPKGQTDVDKAKRELDRYLHYYKRYHAHDEAQEFAYKQLQDTGKKMMALQECKDNATWADVEFLKTANEQLVECRRVLKFTYVFAYYMTTPPKKKVEKDKSSNKKGDTLKEEQLTAEEQKKNRQKEVFETHQGMLEEFTEGLSDMVEKPLKDIDRTGVVNKTRVVKKYIENILGYVEDGMEDV